jgi:hypothetical protein
MKEKTADEVISEIKETMNRLFLKAPRKIKMKEDTYKKIATEVQEQGDLIEVLDVSKQPLNLLCGLSIEIDNSIEKDWEVF